MPPSRRARRELWSDFRFTERDEYGDLIPARQHDSYFPVFYVEPLVGNESVLGFDLASDPTRRATLDKATDTGELVITPRILLVQEPGTQHGFLALVPIYQEGIVPDSLAARRKQLKGFTLGVIRIGDLMRAALSSREKGWDGEYYLTDLDASRDERLLYTNDDGGYGSLDEHFSADSDRSLTRFQTDLTVGDRHWRLTLLPEAPEGRSYSRALAWAGAAGVLLLSQFPLVYLNLLRLRTRRIQVVFDDRTSELQAANRALEEEMAERQRMQHHLNDVQKLEAVGQLTGGIAHDFNNLLMAVEGYARRALKLMGDIEVVSRSLEEVINFSQRGEMLTRQLLSFSRRQVHEPRVFRVADELKDIETLLRRSAGDWFELKFEAADDRTSVSTDPGEFAQAVLNLVTNARDAMPDGGTIGIAVRRVNLSAPSGAHLGKLPPGEYAVIEVADRGCGIDADALPHLFEPFFTTKEQGKGTGLGLAMVYGFAEQSGGAVDVESEKGKGATFSIYLPAVERPPEVLAAEQEQESRGNGETILFVDDNQDLLKLNYDVLRDLGYNVLFADNGFDALEIDEECGERIDLLLTDVVMPAMSGFELAEMLQERHPDLKVVFITGFPGRGPCMPTVPTKWPMLQKPVGTAALARAIREQLDSGAPILAPTSSIETA